MTRSIQILNRPGDRKSPPILQRGPAGSREPDTHRETIHMTDPEAGKANNWDALLASLAAFFGAASLWLYRRAGKTPRPPENQKPLDAELLKPLISRLDEIVFNLRATDSKVERVEENVERLDGRVARLGRRLSRMEGFEATDGD